MTGQEDQEAAVALMGMKNSPRSPFVMSNMPTVSVPPLDLNSMSKNGFKTQDFVKKDNINSLLLVLQQNAPIPPSPSSRKPRRASMFSSGSAAYKDEDEEMLPRLRSQSRSKKRRSSVTFQGSRKARRRIASVDSVKSQPAFTASSGITTRYKTRSASLATFNRENRSHKPRVGIYNAEQRKALIARWSEKRKNRQWHKRIRYNVRKTFADSRLRVKGRFISKEDEAILRECMMFLA